jgi:hypothetical protein
MEKNMNRRKIKWYKWINSKKIQIEKDNINKIQIEDERAKFDSYTEAKNNYVKVLESNK